MRRFAVLSLALLPLFGNELYAEEDSFQQAIADVLAQADVEAGLSGEVRFFFGDQLYPVPKAHRGAVAIERSSRSFNKAPAEACAQAFGEALLALDARARREGGNAVVDIVSVLDGEELVSAEQYQCSPGTLTADVILKGSVVTLP